MKKLLILFLVVGVFGSSLGVRADEVYTFVVKKQEEKAKNRWSLAEWLDTRDRMRMMDLWLALHSPSPYEFYLGGDYRSATIEGQAGQTGFGFYAAAYASIFGLSLERLSLAGEPRVSDTMGLFHFRFFGFHAQATNLTLLGGIRSSKRAEGDYRGATAGLSATVYFGKFFGIEGRYLHFYDTVPGSAPYDLSGNTYEGGAFIDFRFLRVYGKYFENRDRLSFSGGLGGVRLFF